MKNFPLQAEFIERIKGKLPPHVSLADEIANLLNISVDSAYRRIRSETALSLEEAFLLSKAFSTPLDTIAGASLSTIGFSYQTLPEENLGMKSYFHRILEQMRMIHSVNEKEIFYYAKDVPLFHFFQVPEIAAFKMYFWSKFVYRIPGTEDLLFSPALLDKESATLGKRILEYYCGIPTSELWNEETIHSTLLQIRYCRSAGLIRSKEEAWSLLDKFLDLVRHIRKQAELGFKFIFGQNPDGVPGNYKLFLNEVLIGDNSILVRVNGQIQTFLPHNTLNYLVTDNQEFGEHSLKKLESLMRSSTLISSVSEKDRTRFFLNMEEKIRKVKEEVV